MSASQPALRILLVEDDDADAVHLEILLQEVPEGKFLIGRVKDLASAVAVLHEDDDRPDLVLLDLSLADSVGIDTLNRVNAAAAEIPIVVLTGLADDDAALQAVQQGAQDYLMKGRVDAELFSRSIRYAIERKHGERRLTFQAYHDPLTGLANRTLFLDRLELALARARRAEKTVGALYLDLDHFKSVNDRFGHEAGDALLVAVAQRLASLLRPSDTLARLGGDEFTVLCEDIEHEDDLLVVARRIQAALSAPFRLPGDEVVGSASIGVTVAASGDSADQLLREADNAMYRAKREGRGCVEFFSAEMRAEAKRRQEIETELEAALRRGDISLAYQPIIDLTHEYVVAFEALLRWNHPAVGVVPAGEFIPVAERSALIVDLGAWALRQACRDARRLRAKHPNVAVSVNLSTRQLTDPTLPNVIRDALAEAELPPDALWLELTETAAMDEGASDTTVQQITRLGVRFSIDDFGKGYSSLLRLRKFPAAILKVDGSFIDGLMVDPDDEAIVGAVVSLAHALGRGVVAEGVENHEQLARLRGLGCDYGQGYYIAEPLPLPASDV